MITQPELLAKIDAILPEAAALRHDLHRMPEIAGKEFDTARKLREKLAELPQFQAREPYLDTDVTALLDTGRPGRTVALRADIDALPVAEATGVAYASTRPGMMHACGHDGHMAMLYGAARVLAELAPQLNGRVKLIFQPGEEVRAMGRELVAAGVLDDVDFVAALHGWPGIPVGKIATRAGAVMASAAHFDITIFGRGGHGSAPEKTIDPVVIGSELVLALQSVVARETDPQDAAVLSICRFSAGVSSNVIPDHAELNGTVRALSPEVAGRFEPAIRRIAAGVAAAHGARCELAYRDDYGVTVNRPECFELARRAVQTYLGAENFIEEPRSMMAAEDFSYFLARCPGIYARIGVGEDQVGLHHPRYDFNDQALRHGIAFLVATVLENQA